MFIPYCSDNTFCSQFLLMEAILNKVGLGNLCETFRKEKVAPDIICLMSAYKLRQFGVNLSSDMMALRVAASTFGCQQLSKVHTCCGPPESCAGEFLG